MSNKLVYPLKSGTNNYLNPVDSITGLATDLVVPGAAGTLTNTAGIAPMTGSGAVNAQGVPNMSVAVTGGSLYVSATPTGDTAKTWRVTQDVSENVTISSNASGATRYDFLYMSLDPNNLNNPSVTGLNVATLVTSRSTTAYNAADTVAFGNSNGAQANTLLLAVITVVNSATSITNANITDARILAGFKVAAATLTSNPYKFSVYRNAAMTTTNSNSLVPFDSKTFDTGTNIDVVTNKGRFTAPVNGFYFFTATFGNSSIGDTGQCYLMLFKNGALIRTGEALTSGAASSIIYPSVSGLLQLVAGDYVEVYYFGGSGSAAGVGATSNNFDGYLVSVT